MSSQGKLTYNNKQKLKSRKLIEQLFSNGKQVQRFPVKALYSFVDNSSSLVQAGVAVSSRNFKKAVDRNRIKRILRESFRLQKTELEKKLQDSNRSLIVFFIYSGREIEGFASVKDKMGILLKKLTTITSSQ